MQVIQILKKHGFYFKKAFGQNFLTDEGLLDEIVDLSKISDMDDILEIGPGAGTLTRALCKKAKSVTCYEIDQNLKPVLEEVLQDYDNYKVIFKDIMKVSMDEIENAFPNGYYVVANLPYYITTPILMRFIEDAKKVKGLILTVQKEVAERLSAKAGSKDYGAITAGVNFVGEGEIVKILPRDLFTPAPNVDSAVVKISVNFEKFKGTSVVNYRETVKNAFAQRRKTLCNNLMNGFKLSRDTAERILEKLGVNKDVRGEVLSAEKFVELTHILQEEKVFSY